MNFQLLGELLRLRYKLMWAKTRSRNGKIALFMAGYLLLVAFLILMAAGGFGAAILAIRSGKAEMVAQAVLTSLYIEAIFAVVMLGFGMNAVFTDVELRRYPVGRLERMLARHVIGILDPFWFLIIALELGLAVGLYIAGTYNFFIAVIAVLLLFLSNYLLARVVGVFIDRLMTRKSGSAILMALVMALAFLPSAVAPFIKKKAQFAPVLKVMQYSPPFGAASAMTHTGAACLPGFGLLLFWLALFGTLLVIMETRPARRQAAQTTAVTWHSPLDSVAALTGPANAPFVAFWLRFYARNNRFRALYALSLPLVAFITFNMGRNMGNKGAPVNPDSYFYAALGAISVISFLGTSRIAVNQFGYVGGAFRRFFLLPTDPGTSLRTGSYACVLAGSLMIPVGLLAWIVFAPGGADPRKIFMLAGSAITGLFVGHGLGVWVTIFNPRKGNYNSSLGNDMSLMGNIVVISFMLCGFFLPQVLKSVLPAAVSPANWWFVLPLPVVAVVFYMVSLQRAGGLVSQRREQLLAIVEGRES